MVKICLIFPKQYIKKKNNQNPMVNKILIKLLVN